MTIFIYAFLGLLAHLIIKYVKAVKAEDFKFITWIKNRLPDIILTAIAVVVFINAQDDVFKYFAVPDAVANFLNNSTTYAFLLGYMGSSMLKNVMSTIPKYFKKKK